MMDADQQPVAESDENSIAVLFRQHNAALVRYLTAQLQSEQEAKEVAQETYVRLLQMQRAVAPEMLRAYLFKTAGNLAIDRLRRRQVRHRVERSEPPDEWLAAGGDDADPAKIAMASELTDQLIGFLQELPATCREVFTLHRLEGMPQHEVARRLGFSDRMVRRYVTYTMVYCRLRLDGIGADDARNKVSL